MSKDFLGIKTNNKIAKRITQVRVSKKLSTTTNIWIVSKYHANIEEETYRWKII